jgi:HAD superfamily hydrolase (TIGR01484 family)
VQKSSTFQQYEDGQYATELRRLEHTYKHGLASDVLSLARAIAGASQSSVIGVGSGGSFTVASLLCNLHETLTGRVSRPSTPLEIISNPSLAATSPAFFISAEGQNPDISEALVRARFHSARPIHVLTNRETSPLADTVRTLTDIGMHVFPLADKDGYLATNSLLLDATLVARAYDTLAPDGSPLPSAIEQLTVGEDSVDAWLASIAGFTKALVKRRTLMVLYAPYCKPIAADLESKLSESALMYAHLADLRSFAHGRHLWLAKRPEETAVLALVDASLARLWEHMRSLIPSEVPCATLNVGPAMARGLLAGLVAALRFVGSIANHVNVDPGRPTVPAFGRSLYYADLASLVESPTHPRDTGERDKLEVIGARWPYRGHSSAMQRACAAYRMQLEKQAFRAIVFDYDGTVCATQQGDAPPSQTMASELCRLTGANVTVAIVSGRGGSMRERLRESLPQSEWEKIQLGLYSGGWITNVASTSEAPGGTSEFLYHATRIARQLEQIGVPIADVRPTHPYQVSIRFQPGVDTADMWFVFADALRRAGLDLSSMLRSRHSIDILAPGVGKAHIVGYLVEQYRLLPHEVLTIGDQGAWPGNDATLLEHRFSLSVDFPSRRIDRGWKFAPMHRRGVDATLWYLERIHLRAGGKFEVRLTEARTASLE